MIIGTFGRRWSKTLIGVGMGVSVAIPAAALGLQSPQVAVAASPGSSFANRGDIRDLPTPLKNALVALSKQPVAFPPQTAFNEAAGASQLFQYYLLDQRNFQPNVFSSASPATAAIRVVLEPKPGLPTDPNNVKAAIDTFTDVVGLPVLNNEANFYEGWYFHDVVVPPVASPRPGTKSAKFGTITQADANALLAMGSHNNAVGHVLTQDGNTPNFGSASDHFGTPGMQPNTVPVAVSAGTFNGLQRGESHAYWEFNTGTDWSPPTYELPFTGGIPGTLGQQYQVPAEIAGSGTVPKPTDPPNNPRNTESTAETRNRFIPSGLANEVLLDVYARPVSFEPNVSAQTVDGLQKRILDAYGVEVSRVDGSDHDGNVSFNEADVNGTSDGLPNTRLYLPAPAFNRFAVTQELDNGLLSQRFAPSQRAFVLSGNLVTVNPAVPASVPPPS
jgi:hypothetical protein